MHPRIKRIDGPLSLIVIAAISAGTVFGHVALEGECVVAKALGSVLECTDLTDAGTFLSNHNPGAHANVYFELVLAK